MELGQKLREIRKSKNLSLEEVANDLELSKGYLSKVERGIIKDISVNKAKEFADYYNVKIQDLLEKNENWKEKLPDKIKQYTTEDNINYLKVGLTAKEYGIDAEDAIKLIKFLADLAADSNLEEDEYREVGKKAKEKGLSVEKAIKVIDAFSGI